MNRSTLAIGGAAGIVLALVSAPAFAGAAEVCYQNVTTTELKWNEEHYQQTSAEVPATYIPLYDFNDSGDNGHVGEATAEGLRIFTEGTTSEDQVRLLQFDEFPLAGVTSAGVEFINTSGGGVPSAQLLIDTDEIGLSEGTLVAEAIYGDVVWLTPGSSDAIKALAPHVGGGGYGSDWWGTLEEWGAALPGAMIVAVGFSLGSGVLGDGIVQWVYVDDFAYPFVQEDTPAVPAVYEWVVVGSGQGKALPASTEGVRFVQTGTVDVVTKVEVACTLPATGGDGASPWLVLSAFGLIVAGVAATFGRRLIKR